MGNKINQILLTTKKLFAPPNSRRVVADSVAKRQLGRCSQHNTAPHLALQFIQVSELEHFASTESTWNFPKRAAA
jgi:hypothetical protein